MSNREIITAVLAATSFYLDPFRILLLAMVAAEGGRDAFVRALQCSMPDVQTFEVALARACKTVRGLADTYVGDLLIAVPREGKDPWTDEDRPRCLVVTDTFIDRLADKWAPRGVENDPTDLNRNWPVNVKALVRRIAQERDGDPFPKGGEPKLPFGGTTGAT